jgi:septal ring factor EnvC (AmiA/AmiB activator)
MGEAGEVNAKTLRCKGAMGEGEISDAERRVAENAEKRSAAKAATQMHLSTDFADVHRFDDRN